MKPIGTALSVCLAGTIVIALDSNQSASPYDLPAQYSGVPGTDAVYDFVVVGGGTAGLTVASRLSQHPTVSVAVIEAGDFYEISNGNLSEVPAYASYYTGNDPVQKNPLDAILVGPTYSVEILTHSGLSNPSFLAEAVEQYNKNRSGILTNVGGDLAGFEKLTKSTLDRSTYTSLQDQFPEDWPHIVFLVLDSYFGTGSGQNPSDLDSAKQYAAASVGLTATFSRGNVSINSSDAAKNPVISPNWLSDPRDLDMAVAAFRRARQLFQANGLKSIVIGEVYPAGHPTTRDQIIEVIRQSANPVYNAVGTNKMGQRNDSLAVVDSLARVIGVDGLRVVDASIFPFLPTSQPCATVCKFPPSTILSETNSALA
ncbi:MAG: hypothetical protein Q9212_002721 [Teloschistes hypoglaucus]